MSWLAGVNRPALLAVIFDCLNERKNKCPLLNLQRPIFSDCYMFTHPDLEAGRWKLEARSSRLEDGGAS
jgi:hypothetical protein